MADVINPVPAANTDHNIRVDCRQNRLPTTQWYRCCMRVRRLFLITNYGQNERKNHQIPHYILPVLYMWFWWRFLSWRWKVFYQTIGSVSMLWMKNWPRLRQLITLPAWYNWDRGIKLWTILPIGLDCISLTTTHVLQDILAVLHR